VRANEITHAGRFHPLVVQPAPQASTALPVPAGSGIIGLRKEAVMSTPKVSFSDLEDAFLDSSYEHQYWLDKQTGEVLFVDEEISRSLELGEDMSNVPEWRRDFIEQARRVLRAFGELPGQED
jgi:hypothetical protein